MRKFSTLALVVMVILAVLAMAGCGNTNEPAATPAEGQTATPAEGHDPDSITISYAGEPTSLLSWESNDLTTNSFCCNLYDTLIRQDENGEMVPGLASEWSYNEDGTEITFTLRDDVLFHNGDKMTADDVVFSLNSAIASSYTTRMTASMVGAEKIDDSHVLLKLKYAYGVVEGCLSSVNCSIVSKAAYEADPDGFSRNPVGTGAYKLVAWNTGEKIVMEAFDQYYRGEAPIKNLTYMIISDSASALVSLETNQIDVIASPSSSDYQYIMDNTALQLQTCSASSFYFVAFNNTDGMFAGEEGKVLRQAVCMAIDPESCLIGACDGFGEVVATPIPNPVKYSPAEFDGYTYDQAGAAQLLKDNGLEGKSIVLKSMDSGVYGKVAEIVAEQLRAIGLTVDVQLQERTSFLTDVYTNCQYEICVNSYTAFYPDADFIMYNRYHSAYLGGGNNFVMANYPELDTLLDTGRFSSDEATREQAYYDACVFMRDNYVMCPILSTLNAVAADARLQGLEANATQRIEVYNLSWE